MRHGWRLKRAPLCRRPMRPARSPRRCGCYRTRGRENREAWRERRSAKPIAAPRKNTWTIAASCSALQRGVSELEVFLAQAAGGGLQLEVVHDGAVAGHQQVAPGLEHLLL